MPPISASDLLFLFPLTASAIVTLLSVWMLRRQPHPLLLWWTRAHLLGFAALLLESAHRAMGHSVALMAVALVVNALSGSCLFEVGFQLRLRPPCRWRHGALAAVLAACAGLGMARAPVELMSLPAVLFTGAGFVWLGLVLRRLQRSLALGTPSAPRMLAWALISTGASLLLYPALLGTAVAWIGYWLNGVLLLVVGTGLLVFLYERNTLELKLLLDGSRNHAFVRLDPGGNIAAWNASAERMFGVSDLEALGRSATMLGELPPLDPKASATRVGWRPRRGEERFWCETIISPIHRDGALHGYSMLVHDLSERRRIEQERSRLEAALELSEDGVIVVDAMGIVRYLNPAAARHFGRSVEEIVGRNITEAVGPRGSATLRQMRRSLLRGEVWTGRLEIPGEGDPARTEELRVLPLRRDGNVVEYLAFERDVTREQALRDQLYQAQKMEEVGKLASNVAHDFGNLLAIIVSYNHLLRSGPVSEESIELATAAIGRATDRASALIQQLLAFGRKEMAQPRDVDVNQIVSRISELLSRLMDEGVELRVKLGRDLGSVWIDPRQLELVITNLVINARDALSGCGLIAVETSAFVGDGQDGMSAGPHVCLSVSDNGCGMEPATMARLFEPFFTTKPVGRGAGLGLPVVEGIVKVAGGAIRVESTSGRGSTFRIYLPVHAEAADADEDEAPGAAA